MNCKINICTFFISIYYPNSIFFTRFSPITILITSNWANFLFIYKKSFNYRKKSWVIVCKSIPINKLSFLAKMTIDFCCKVFYFYHIILRH